MKKISDIVQCDYDFFVSGVCDDSRNVKPGYLFVATKGFFVDHFDYIEDAISRGAVCVIADRAYLCSIPVIIVDNVNNFYIDVCSRYYGVLPDDFNLIGITGTDGKTTTATIVARLLNQSNKCAYLGTNGLEINDKYYPTNNTTPCVSELFDSLSLIKNDNCKDLVMEVSSEALLHDRLKKFKFDVVGFTNITEDHLNIHCDIDNYISSKLKILNLIKKNGIVVVNGDDEICKRIDKENVYTFGFDSVNDFVIFDVKEMSKCVEFSLKYNDLTYRITSPFLGNYNIYNVTMAFVICLLKGVDSNMLIESIKNLSPVLGRGEYLDFGQKYDIVLDYAHTYNGIKNILNRFSYYKSIIVVTGAAGGREKEKRAKIGKLLLDKANVCIFTMDDPRYESADEIIDQMIDGSKKDYIRIIDRKQAIFKALSLAVDDSVVLILGKGRDNYMAIGDRKEKYCDYDVVVEYFNCLK